MFHFKKQQTELKKLLMTNTLTYIVCWPKKTRELLHLKSFVIGRFFLRHIFLGHFCAFMRNLYTKLVQHDIIVEFLLLNLSQSDT